MLRENRGQRRHEGQASRDKYPDKYPERKSTPLDPPLVSTFLFFLLFLLLSFLSFLRFCFFSSSPQPTVHSLRVHDPRTHGLTALCSTNRLRPDFDSPGISLLSEWPHHLISCSCLLPWLAAPTFLCWQSGTTTTMTIVDQRGRKTSDN